MTWVSKKHVSHSIQTRYTKIVNLKEGDDNGFVQGFRVGEYQ